RQFQRSFLLADGIEVQSARMADGLLHIDLRRPRAEEVVREIKITSADS
ncbi:MAG: Hsp20 family protein, partial [Alphaproteobacteria bacterium]|nr:Hsp20 family protein [Alphaproteobacteria bacterium]MDX5369433.1 Hsp20 family protein [Alphaproteobacteria bacterium]MDX5464113.1 Hsp20 family protein [Alphaproteobacteria bacterium]